MSELSGAELLRISALGLYRAFINGAARRQRPADARLDELRQAPFLPDLRGRSAAQAGRNVIDIWLADGWYRSQMMWTKNPIFNTWGSEIAAIAELRARRRAPMRRSLLKTDDTLDKRRAADPKVRHLFRRDLRRPAGRLEAAQRQRGDPVRHLACWCRTRSSRCAS